MDIQDDLEEAIHREEDEEDPDVYEIAPVTELPFFAEFPNPDIDSEIFEEPESDLVAEIFEGADVPNVESQSESTMSFTGDRLNMLYTILFSRNRNIVSTGESSLWQNYKGRCFQNH